MGIEILCSGDFPIRQGAEMTRNHAGLHGRRYQEYTGKRAVLDGEGATYDEVALERVGILT